MKIILVIKTNIKTVGAGAGDECDVGAGNGRVLYCILTERSLSGNLGGGVLDAGFFCATRLVLEPGVFAKHYIPSQHMSKFPKHQVCKCSYFCVWM